ncbi:hypothetical protein QR98_0016280 [Sarcoptes scabiei]|uniref:Uncharacterized protein n=1 Tax=Sarcoptes scabiei TaxID=52283 RepID=A0A131ZWE9_SARSC|nr:hypothetical protein QR98_0016280 [Sarcoptes scabiei]
MKIIIIGLTLLPLVLSTGYDHGGGGDHGYHKYEEHYPPQPYKFGYDVKDGYGGTLNQKEEGDEYGNKKGTYGYTDSYGIYRQVDYVADKHGFRATIKTNEPGTASQNHGYKSDHHGYKDHSYAQSKPSTSISSSPITLLKSSASTSQPSPVFKMPAVYLQPKTVYKSVPFDRSISSAYGNYGSLRNNLF